MPDGCLTKFRSMPAFSAIGTFLFVIVLSGCTVGPTFVQPVSGLDQVILTPKDSQDGLAQLNTSAVPVEWWSLFDDQELSRLQQLAQAQNLDLQIAAVRIEQSRAQ